MCARAQCRGTHRLKPEHRLEGAMIMGIGGSVPGVVSCGRAKGYSIRAVGAGTRPRWVPSSDTSTAAPFLVILFWSEPQACQMTVKVSVGPVVLVQDDRIRHITPGTAGPGSGPPGNSPEPVQCRQAGDRDGISHAQGWSGTISLTSPIRFHQIPPGVLVPRTGTSNRDRCCSRGKEPGNDRIPDLTGERRVL